MKFVERLFGRKTPGPAPTAEPARQTPPRCPGNPGRTVGGRIELTNGERSWTETFHLIPIAAGVLRGRGHEVVEHETWLELRPSGFILQPLLVDIQLLEKGGMHTLTTIDVRHPELIREGLFEYQHSTGNGVEESVRKGFESWESVDLPVLLDALRPRPQTCTLFEMTLPAREGRPERVRRAVLGSVACYSEHPHEAAGAGSAKDAESDHAFCNCCFLTRNYEVFRSQIEGDGCVGIRFYAKRDPDGTPGADCRLNGEDYAPGMEALRSYVATWPGSGFEFRKQYVLIHTAARPLTSSTS